jgi:hypothetical protein
MQWMTTTAYWVSLVAVLGATACGSDDSSDGEATGGAVGGTPVSPDVGPVGGDTTPPVGGEAEGGGTTPPVGGQPGPVGGQPVPGGAPGPIGGQPVPGGEPGPIGGQPVPGGEPGPIGGQPTPGGEPGPVGGQPTPGGEPPPAGGACTNAADQQALADAAAALQEAIGGCVFSCLGQPQVCVEDCVQETAAISDGCAECFGTLVTCTVMNCAAACFDPAGAACAECRATNCNDAFVECAGIQPQ